LCATFPPHNLWSTSLRNLPGISSDTDELLFVEESSNVIACPVSLPNSRHLRDVGTTTEAKEVRDRREIRGNITSPRDWADLSTDDVYKITLELKNGRRINFVFEDVLSGRIVGSEP